MIHPSVIPRFRPFSSIMPADQPLPSRLTGPPNPVTCSLQPCCLVKQLSSWSEIPDFGKDEKAEAGFWMTHQLDLRLMNDSIHRANVRESTTITLRFDPQMLSRIKRLARHRYLNYQSMIKQWLSERLEEEVKKVDPTPPGPSDQDD